MDEVEEEKDEEEEEKDEEEEEKEGREEEEEINPPTFNSWIRHCV